MVEELTGGPDMCLPRDADMGTLVAKSDEVRAELSAAEDRRDAALAEIEKETGEVQGRRTGVAGEIPADLLKLYEKLREQYGVGAAMLHGGRCQGCKVALSIAEMNRIKAAPHDEVLRCEECRRILVRTAESGL